MKKLLFISCLFCLSITGYSQRKETKIFVSEKRATLDNMPVSKTSPEDYQNLRNVVENYSRTLNKKWGNSLPMEFVWDGIPKKDKILLQSLYISIRDSISKRYYYDKEVARLENIRIQQQNDSIKLAKEKAAKLYQDSIKIAQELKIQRDKAVRDSISQEKAKDPDFNVIDGKGNGTFTDSPNTLARIFTKNATVESIVATFQRYRAYYATEFPDGRRERSYDVYKGNEHYSVKLEYYAKTRKVKTIIIDAPYTDKYKQRLLNAGYRWDSSSSMTATSFGHGYHSYWEKKGSRVCFVFNDRILKVFRID